MAGYTLKLDLPEYDRAALITVLSTEIQRAERDGRQADPYPAALARVLDQIENYESAVAEAKRITADWGSGVQALREASEAGREARS